MDKKFIPFLILIFFSALVFSCKNSDADEVVEIRPGKTGSNAELIKSPVTAQGLTDTANMAKISFEEPVFDFGTIHQGQVITHLFKFKNTGKTPLIISDGRSTCGCTVPEWPKNPVAPGDTASVKVVFNSEGKKDAQNKAILIYANTFPAENKIYVTGTVK